jgi:hypothetical protein
MLTKKILSRHLDLLQNTVTPTFKRDRAANREQVGEWPIREKEMDSNTASGQQTTEIGSEGLTLFRRASLQRHANQAIGSTLLIMPFTFRLWAALALCMIVAFASFVAFGSYTTTESVKSVVVPMNGIEKVYGKGDGMLVEIFVQGGDRVEKGDPLVSVRDKDSGDGNGDVVLTHKTDPLEEKSVKAPVSTSENTKNDAASGEAEPKARVLRSPVGGIVYQVKHSPRAQFYEFQEVVQIAVDGPLSVKFEISPKTKSEMSKGAVLRFSTVGQDGKASATFQARVISVARSPSERFNQLTSATEYSYTVVCLVEEKKGVQDHSSLLGAVVESKVPQEKRKLYEWMFDPMKRLFSQ